MESVSDVSFPPLSEDNELNIDSMEGKSLSLAVAPNAIAADESNNSNTVKKAGYFIVYSVKCEDSHFPFLVVSTFGDYNFRSESIKGAIIATKIPDILIGVP